ARRAHPIRNSFGKTAEQAQNQTHKSTTGKAAAPAHFAAVIESTWIVLVLASSVPVTVTFFPANFSGVCWSLSVKTSLPSYRIYMAPCAPTQAMVHSASVGPIRIRE